ncbi:mitochondrial ribosomal protein S15 [Laetiporus sulphureus 93-53]|uniref:Mitochondrial ribosomal protein S15 n=1 Tax=Laetiporus sulphureus 93-53 TaxID=1314785 RepID=A0A165BJR3_9APHY|nr:mitochondrial ribosomal protein S15 [Laetiporus sulphureus 93-53]KZT01189.1 mitochondrial ribosomal protein S15 [Laetiporus sulphureus 93-53]
MLRARLAQCSRSVASSSSSSACPASLHTSAVLQVSLAHRRKSRATQQANIQKRKERELAATGTRPHVVLGHRPGDEAKWKSCDLAKIIITEEDIFSAPMPPASAEPGKELQIPEYMNFGMGEREKEMLFDVLPQLTIEGHFQAREENPEGFRDLRERLDLVSQSADMAEASKRTFFARLVDLRNANARGIAFENRKRIVEAFSEPDKPNDTGRPEVQASILTFRIRSIWHHLIRSKRDVSSRRSLRLLVHQRAKVLKYLKRLDRDRYDRVLERLGLEPGSVEGELVV